MAKPNLGVCIKVHESFFNNWFEPNRRRLEKQIGIGNLSQLKFTQYLGTGKMNMDMSMFSNKKKRFKFNVKI